VSLHIARCVTQAFIRIFEDQVLRMAMGKAANQSFSPGVHSGKLNDEKVRTITDSWVRFICRSLPGVDVVEKSAYVFADGGDAAPKADEVAECKFKLCCYNVP
jgi:hypothetical protein